MFYPAIEPYETGFLDRGLHKVYFECSGNKQGEPIVFLHGGPGSGTAPWQRQLFNPEKFNIILLDQRGCGKSTPHTCLENNTTDHLVDDIHVLKEHLGFDKWHVFGGSWGSTLSLAYADKFADEILSLTVYGIFLCRESELFDLYFEGGVASHVFPEVFEEYISIIPENERDNPIKAYNDILNGDDEDLIEKALYAWTKWELSILRLESSESYIQEELDEEDFVKGFTLLENHYFLNKGFIDGSALLKRIGEKVKNIPVNIMQGRYDMVCPARTAYELHKAIPHSMLTVIPNAGHTIKEKPSMKTMVNILDNL